MATLARKRGLLGRGGCCRFRPDQLDDMQLGFSLYSKSIERIKTQRQQLMGQLVQLMSQEMSDFAADRMSGATRQSRATCSFFPLCQFQPGHSVNSKE